jgi:TolB-like protein/class 3 adenylate cyclase/tetratricopeptide (TPR) repeat protein
MPAPLGQRRLAAIMVADVVGYSRMMSADETATLAEMKALRVELINPKVVEHSGRIFKSTGDGLLVEFPSIVNAVACAVDIQRSTADRNLNISEDKAIRLRIGVNVGDVIAEEDDIFGDGVNLAARVEGLAPPGGIAVTEAVRIHLGNRLDLKFEDLGEQTLKNIDRPVRIYLITVTTSDAVQPLRSVGSHKPSVAVLPFTNMSGDPNQQYFSDGVTEDIITELSRFRSLRVIARNSSFRFRGGDVDIMQVGRQLGAQFVLEGSVRRVGSTIRITAQLIDTATGSHIWAERFDRPQNEVFAVQDQVVRMIVGTLAGRLEALDVEKVSRKSPASLAAYECVLRANALPVADLDAQVEARRLAERAIELDPTYARAHEQLAISFFQEWVHDYSGSNEKLDRALVLAKKAVALDDNDSSAVGFLGWLHMFHRSYDLAEHWMRKSIALNPNRPSEITSLGILYGYLGKPDEAIGYYEQAKLIDQYFEPTWYWRQLAVLHFTAQRYEEAIAHFSRSPTAPDWVHVYLAACYAHLDRKDEARLHLAEALRLVPQLTIEKFLTKEPFKKPADCDRLREGLQKAGLPE